MPVPSLTRTPLRPVLALVAVWAAACGGVEDPGRAMAIPAGAPRVLVLGDSFAAGYEVGADQGFPAVLQRRLLAADVPFHLEVDARPGRTADEGVALADGLLADPPDLLVLELGFNDGQRVRDLAELEGDLRTIAERARGAGTRVLLLGTHLEANYGVDYAEDFAATFERLAADLGLAFVPAFTRGVVGLPEWTLPDGIHPTAEGHELLADGVEGKLTEVLKGLPARSVGERPR